MEDAARELESLELAFNNRAPTSDPDHTSCFVKAVAVLEALPHPGTPELLVRSKNPTGPLATLNPEFSKHTSADGIAIPLQSNPAPSGSFTPKSMFVPFENTPKWVHKTGLFADKPNQARQTEVATALASNPSATYVVAVFSEVEARRSGDGATIYCKRTQDAIVDVRKDDLEDALRRAVEHERAGLATAAAADVPMAVWFRPRTSVTNAVVNEISPIAVTLVPILSSYAGCKGTHTDHVVQAREACATAGQAISTTALALGVKAALDEAIRLMITIVLEANGQKNLERISPVGNYSRVSFSHQVVFEGRYFSAAKKELRDEILPYAAGAQSKAKTILDGYPRILEHERLQLAKYHDSMASRCLGIANDCHRNGRTFEEYVWTKLTDLFAGAAHRFMN